MAVAIAATESDTLMVNMPKIEDGFEHFRRWITQIHKCLSNDQTADQWIRLQWEKLNYQTEDAERVRDDSRVYSLEQLQTEYGREHHNVFMDELRQRVLATCKSRTETYKKLTVKQRTSVAQDVSTIRESLVSLQKLKDDLAKKQQDIRERKKVLHGIDPSYKVKTS